MPQVTEEPDLCAAIDRLGKTALRIKAERDELLNALKEMVDAYWRGSEDSDDEDAPSVVKGCARGHRQVRSRLMSALRPHPLRVVATNATFVPMAKDDPPWCECGDRASPDFGKVFAEPGSGNSLIFWFDRERTRYAFTSYEAHKIGRQVVIHGRRFDVVRVERRPLGAA